MSVFSGLSAFPLTPADADGKVLIDDQRRLLRHLAEARHDQQSVDSICLLGSTGIYAYLTVDERKLAVEAGLDQIGGQIPVIVGVGALRTDDAVRLARHADASGAQGLLLAPISYTPLTADEVYRHYATVADATGLPLCIYNNPSTTHFSFPPELLTRLAQLPNIEAVKMPLPSNGGFGVEIARLRDALPDGFIVGYSGDWECPDALLAGADSWFSVIAGLLPAPTLALAAAAKSGDADLTQQVNAAFQPMWALFRKHGSLRVIYAAAYLLSLTSAQPPRPILPLAEDELPKVQQAMDALTELQS